MNVMVVVDGTEKTLSLQLANLSLATGEDAASGARAQGTATQVTPTAQKKAKPNDPCPCGSGLKYKKCCRK